MAYRITGSIHREEITDDHLEFWLWKIKDVKHESALSCLVQQLRWFQELRTFLQNLDHTLREIDDVNVALSRYPSVGQLLGRLCAIPTLLIIPEVYKPLMRCVLCFCSATSRNSCYTSDEDAIAKAKVWALTQLRNSVSFTRNYFPTITLDKTGFTQEMLNEACLSEVCDKMFSSPKERNDELLKRKEYSEIQLCELIEICSYLLHVPQYCKLMVKAISLLTSRSFANETLMKVTKSLCSEDRIDKNMYQMFETLWLQHLPSLEFIVVHVTTDFVKTRLKGRNKSLCQHLVRACSEHSCIYSAVFHMLEQMWNDSGMDVNLSCFIAHLHGKVRRNISNQQNEAIQTLISQFPFYLRPVVGLMQILPTSLSPTACEKMLIKIAHSFTNLDENPFPELKFTLVEYGIWIDTAYVIALHGTKKVLKSCCKIMLRESEICVDSSKIQQLLEILKPMRGLFAKSFVRKSDLQFLLSLCAVEDKFQFRHILQKLLLIFVVHIGGERDEIELMLDQGVRCDSKPSRLECIMMTIDTCAPFWSSDLTKEKWNRDSLFDIELYLAYEVETTRLSSPNRSFETIDCDANKTVLGSRVSDAIGYLKKVVNK